MVDTRSRNTSGHEEWRQEVDRGGLGQGQVLQGGHEADADHRQHEAAAEQKNARARRCDEWDPALPHCHQGHDEHDAVAGEVHQRRGVAQHQVLGQRIEHGEQRERAQEYREALQPLSRQCLRMLSRGNRQRDLHGALVGGHHVLPAPAMGFQRWPGMALISARV